MKSCDYLVIGADIIGLSVARELKQQDPTKRIIVVEKEADVADHESVRNSGMLHAGVYYSKGSLKTKITREDNELLRAYAAAAHGLTINTNGVACDEHSFHVLNAVSPGFTCSFSFAQYIVDEAEKNRSLKPYITILQTRISFVLR